jgi:predicted enzyme related to lactoylglutathione lyase
MISPRLTSSAAVLLVRDVVAAAKYYRDALGFTYDRFWGEPANFVILRRDGMQLMLDQAPSGFEIVPNWRVNRNMWNLYFWVDDADKLLEEFTRRGAKIDYDIHDKPYDVREFGVQDLDGYDIGFGQPKTPNAEQASRSAISA